jgi:hypothetical protein
MYKNSGHGAEEATKLPAHLILGHLEDGDEVSLAVISEPHLNPIGQDRHDHRLEDPSPMQEGKATDGVPKDPQSMNCAPGTSGQGLHMQRP